jgi:putative membrane protein
MGWWMVFGGVWMVAFWGIVIGLTAWGIRRMTGGNAERSDSGEAPMEIARKRLARGEITAEEFEVLKCILQ